MRSHVALVRLALHRAVRTEIELFASVFSEFRVAKLRGYAHSHDGISEEALQTEQKEARFREMT